MGDFRGGGRGGSGFSGPRGGFQGGRGAGGGRGGFRGGRGGGGGGSFGYDQNAPMPSASRPENKITQGLAHGTEGRPIELLANYYKLMISEDRLVYHYDIDISRKKDDKVVPLIRFSDSESSHSSDSPSSDSNSDHNEDPIGKAFNSSSSNEDRFVAKFASEVIEKMLAENDTFASVRHAHDGLKNLYTTQKFNFQGHNVVEIIVRLPLDNRPADFKVRVKLVEQVPVKEVIDYYAKKKDYLSERVLSVFEIILRFIMGKHYVTFQRKLFDINSITSSNQVRLAEFVSGFTSAVRITEFGLALNVHLKTSCVISRQITEVSRLALEVAGIQMGHRPTKNQISDFNRFIRFLRIFTEHSKRKVHYTVDGMIDKTVYDIKFSCKKSGQEITIAQYFINEYGITPVKDTPAMKMTKSGVFLPLELCFLVPNQFLSNSKINSQIQRELLLKATNTPNVYFNKLAKVVEKVAVSEPALQQEFGINLDPSPVSFMGRVLDAPRLLNSNRNDSFNQVGQMPQRWGVFCFDSNVSQESLNNFVKMMKDRARSFGFHLGDPHPVAIIQIRDRGMVLNAFSNLRSKSGAEFIFVGVPSRHQVIPPAQLYGLIKYYCDQQFGIASQCFKAEFVDQLPNGYFDQFLLKVNGKCGGLNSLVEPKQLREFPFSLARTMFVGIDVNHPAQTQKVASSVSAAVASLDPNFSRYAASIFAQKKDRDEILKNLEPMICELLEEYQKVNNAFPENLVIFRDGVSEGQYQMVRATELPSIRSGVKKMTQEPIKITLIVVQKRHNTRFSLTTVNSQGRRPTWNVPSGTVVDNTIVEPLYKTFYLNSHFSPLGTSRPTKYTILEDDLKMNANDLQKMAFLLCHNSIRTRGVIAIPTPVRYADLCCYRSKLHIEAQYNLVDSTIGSGKSQLGEEEEKEIIRRLNTLVKVNEKCQNKLYYC